MRDNILYVLLLILFLGCSKTSNGPPIIQPPVLSQPIPEPLPEPKPLPKLTIHQALINAHNVARKGKTLTPDPQLMIVAQRWAEHMAKTSRMKHQSLSVIKGYRTCGENIAMGQNSIEEVMRCWLRSPGHRRNIMNSNYTHIGVGYAVGRNGTKFWCVDFGG